MIKQTTKVKILVADHRKIGLTSKFKIADITAFDCLIKGYPSRLKKERRTKIKKRFLSYTQNLINKKVALIS